MQININEVINKIDLEIKQYTEKFLTEKMAIEESTSNHASILFERTLSSTVNYFLFNYFKQLYGDNLKICVNEFKIEIKNDINGEKRKKHRVDVDLKNDPKQRWNYCIVDGYFKIDKFVDDSTKHIFIEYKMQDDFEFIDLATDFLKYKLYTDKNKENTIFIYVIFDKKENYPTILNGDTEQFLYIKDIIRETQFKEKKVFIYQSDVNNPLDAEQTKKVEETLKVLDDLTLVKDQYIDVLAKTTKQSKTNHEELILSYLPKYNSLVIKSSIIKRNYKFIKHLWDEANKMNLFKDIHQSFDLDNKDQLSIDLILKEGSHYNYYFEETINLSDKIEAEENGIRGGYYSSLNLIALLDYLSDFFNIKCDKPEYGYKIFGRSNSKKQKHDYQKTADNQKNKIEEIYKNDPDRNKKFLKLLYSLTYYIIEVYPILFEINTDLEVVSPTNLNLLEKLDEEMRKLLHNIAKLIEVKLKITNIKTDLNEIIKMFVQLLDKYR